MTANIKFVLEISKRHKIADALQILQKILVDKAIEGMSYKILHIDSSEDELSEHKDLMKMLAGHPHLQNWNNPAFIFRGKAKAGITALVSAESEEQIKRFGKLLRKERITFKIKDYTGD